MKNNLQLMRSSTYKFRIINGNETNQSIEELQNVQKFILLVNT